MGRVLLLTLVGSPIVVGVLALSLVIHAKSRAMPKPGVAFLLLISVVYSALCIAALVAYMYAWMASYRANTGFSAGNAPAALILGVPFAIAIGQSLGLAHWWFKEVGSSDT